MMAHWLQSRWPILAILAGFLLIGGAYSVVNPLHEATDELRHYRFIQHVIQLDALPVQGELPCSTQGHHPPLYYATAALVTGGIDTGREVCAEPAGNPFWAYRYWDVGVDNKNQYLHGEAEAFPWQGEALAAQLSRFVNLFFGAATVWLTWLIALTIWPGNRALAAGSAAFIAFNPMFLYMAAAINNDVVAALAGAAVTLACVRLLVDEEGLRWQWGVALGVLFGIALLSKFNLAAIIVTIEAAVTWVAWRRKQWREWLVVNALIVGLSVVVAGWWFARNQLLYGEPTGFERLTELWGVRSPLESFGLAVSELPYAWTSLWGRFGYGQIPLPPAFYIAIFVVALVALAGYGVTLIRRESDRLRDVAAPLALLALNVALFFAVLFNYLLVSPAGPMGRFFFPALPSLAILMFFGLSLWRRSGAQQRLPRTLAAATAAGMVAFSLVALFGYLAPAYARPATYAAEAALPNPVEARFDGLVALRGYDVRLPDGGDSVAAGEPIDIDLYWEVTGQPPGDYYLFVHLIDRETGALIGQRDTHPGLGNFPASQWRPGDRFVERLQLYVPETAYVPADAELRVGYYAPNDGYRLGITDATTGDGLGDSFPLGAVALTPAADGAQPNPGDYNFEDRVRLTGYAYSTRQPAPGQSFDVMLYWVVEQPPGQGQQLVRIQLIGPDGRVVVEQLAALSSIEQGGPVVQMIDVPVDLALAGQTLGVRLVVESEELGRPLNRIWPDGRWIDDELQLAPLVVEP